MTISSNVQFSLLFLFVVLFFPKVWATESQDLTYEEILQEIQDQRSSAMKARVLKSQAPRSEAPSFHGGFGSLSSFSTVKAFERKRYFENYGLQLTLGSDLFSKRWLAQGTFRNYWIAARPDQELALRQIDLKIGARQVWQLPWTSRIGVGLSTRFLTYRDLISRQSEDEVSPAFLFWGGVTAQLSPTVGLGVEAGGRAPFVTSQLDQGSLELALNIEFTL